MKGFCFLRGLKFAALALLIGGALGFAVMTLWNWLTPGLFGWHALTFWQALGLLALTRILVGGMRGGRCGGGRQWRRRMLERWEQMTPEEREKFREGLKRGCGPMACGPEAPEEHQA